MIQNVGKRKAVGKADKSGSKAKKGKLANDPNKPKRPPSAFFVFVEEFRKTFKKENPNVSDVGKAGGEKWKSLSAPVSDPKSQGIAKDIGPTPDVAKVGPITDVANVGPLTDVSKLGPLLTWQNGVSLAT
ncbi:hypothetical protein AgCh_017686 [Apium graveolens]